MLWSAVLPSRMISAGSMASEGAVTLIFLQRQDPEKQFTASKASHWLDSDHVTLGTAGITEKQPLRVHAFSLHSVLRNKGEGQPGVTCFRCVKYLVFIQLTEHYESTGHIGTQMILVKRNLFPY